jgi:hypothetical protein
MALLAVVAAVLHYAFTELDLFSKGWTFVAAIVVSSFIGAVFLGILDKRKDQT